MFLYLKVVARLHDGTMMILEMSSIFGSKLSYGAKCQVDPEDVISLADIPLYYIHTKR
jgi:hypothetical protein